MQFKTLNESQKAELWASLALRHCKGLGASSAHRLLDLYGSALAVVNAAFEQRLAWADLGLVSEKVCQSFSTGNWRAGAREEWEAVQKSACSFVLWSSPHYPPLLKEIHDAPVLLYYSGDITLLNAPAVAIVGSRRCSREGVRMAAFLGRGLSLAGVTVISGMAKGIDRAAHIAGLEGPGRSTGVLGTGVDVIYPSCNLDLAGALSSKGLLVSEFAPGTSPRPKHFPVRNRLISGLARGVLVVEAASRSGSLITARLALDQGREVFAIPGAGSSSSSEGCRELIRRGAKPVFTADDILVELAPLLTHDARVALEARQKGLAKEDISLSIAQALEVLPTGQIPWLAPADKSKVGNGQKSLNDSGRTGVQSRGAGNGPKNACVVQDSEQYQAQAPSAVNNDEHTRFIDLGEDEKRVVEYLGTIPKHIDDLAQATGFDVSKLSGLLTVLEISSMVERHPGMFYTLGNS